MTVLPSVSVSIVQKTTIIRRFWLYVVVVVMERTGHGADHDNRDTNHDSGWGIKRFKFPAGMLCQDDTTSTCAADENGLLLRGTAPGALHHDRIIRIMAIKCQPSICECPSEQRLIFIRSRNMWYRLNHFSEPSESKAWTRCSIKPDGENRAWKR